MFEEMNKTKFKFKYSLLLLYFYILKKTPIYASDNYYHFKMRNFHWYYSVLCGTIWYYSVLFGSIRRSYMIIIILQVFYIFFFN